MKALEALIQALQEDPEVKAYQALEAVLLSHDTLKESHQALLKAQRQLVKEELYQSERYNSAYATYQAQLEQLTDNPFIQNYLEHQESLNHLLQTITTTIELALENALNPEK